MSTPFFQPYESIEEALKDLYMQVSDHTTGASRTALLVILGRLDQTYADLVNVNCASKEEKILWKQH